MYRKVFLKAGNLYRRDITSSSREVVWFVRLLAMSGIAFLPTISTTKKALATERIGDVTN